MRKPHRQLVICIVAQEAAFGSSAITASAVGVFSTAWRRRNHDASEMRRASHVGTPARSRMTMPKPPACTMRSVAFKAFSALPPQRTHNRCGSCIPALAAVWGSKLLPASISAQNSGRRVACAKAALMMLVRPEEGGPQISVSVPRGMSMPGNPVRRSSGAVFSRIVRSMPNLSPRDS